MPSSLFYLSVTSYNRYRQDKIRNLRWEIGPVLPASIESDLSYKENEYYTNYNSLIDEYNEQFGFDITGDQEPPKDLLVEIKVLESCGRIMTEFGSVNLEKGSVLFVRR